MLMLQNNRKLVVILSLILVIRPVHNSGESCRVDSDCRGPKQYCYIYNNCVSCTPCDSYSREFNNSIYCPKTFQDCGPCIRGFKENGETFDGSKAQCVKDFDYNRNGSGLRFDWFAFWPFTIFSAIILLICVVFLLSRLCCTSESLKKVSSLVGVGGGGGGGGSGGNSLGTNRNNNDHQMEPKDSFSLKQSDLVSPSAPVIITAKEPKDINQDHRKIVNDYQSANIFQLPHYMCRNGENPYVPYTIPGTTSEHLPSTLEQQQQWLPPTSTGHFENPTNPYEPFYQPQTDLYNPVNFPSPPPTYVSGGAFDPETRSNRTYSTSSQAYSIRDFSRRGCAAAENPDPDLSGSCGTGNDTNSCGRGGCGGDGNGYFCGPTNAPADHTLRNNINNSIVLNNIINLPNSLV